MPSHPNPQGKGLIPVMESLLASRVQVNIPPKSYEQISCELFTSLFVLHSEFKYKPVIGISYWLYRKNDIFRLSLIEPQQWRTNTFGKFVGECIMQEDMTWTFSLGEQAREDEKLVEYIELQRNKFEQNLSNHTKLKNALPVYDAKLPFYQRILASGLAYSLGISMEKQLTIELETRSRLLKTKL